MAKWFLAAAVLLILTLIGAWSLFSPDAGDGEASIESGSALPESASSSSSAPEAVTGARVSTKSDAAVPGSPGADVADRAEAAFAPQENAVDEGRQDSAPGSSPEDDDALRELHERMRAADALPTERQFLLNDNVKIDATMEMVGSDEFGEVIDELAREAYGDFDAQDLTDVYAGYVNSLIQSRGGFALERLVCGMRICMGQVIALGSEANWQPLNLFRNDGPPMYASADGTYTRPDGTVVYQFLFTTDPGSRGFVIPTP